MATANCCTSPRTDRISHRGAEDVDRHGQRPEPSRKRHDDDAICVGNGDKRNLQGWRCVWGGGKDCTEVVVGEGGGE